MDRERLGAVLRTQRSQAGLTQEQLAERSGLSVRAIRDLECGKVARPHRESVRLLAEALALGEDDHESLMSLAGHPSPTPAPTPAGDTADRPTPPGPGRPASPGADPPAIDPPKGDDEEPEPMDGNPAARPSAHSRTRRAAIVTTIATSTACLAIAIAALWPEPHGKAPTQLPAHAAAPSESSGYVGRLAADAQIISSAGTDLRVDRPVTSGDALVAALMLTSTTAGTIAVTDTAGNHYEMVADVTDPYHHRTAIFAAFKVSPLHAGDHLSFSWPQASKHHIAVEEFHGIAAAKGQAAGFGTYDHSNQAIAAGIPTGCMPGDLVMAALGSNSGPAPALAAGWHRLPELPLSSYRLTIAFRLATEHDGCTLTGTSQAQWETALVSLR